MFYSVAVFSLPCNFIPQAVLCAAVPQRPRILFSPAPH